MTHDEIRRSVQEMLDEMRQPKIRAMATCSRCFGKGCAWCHGRGSIGAPPRQCSEGCAWCRALREETGPSLTREVQDRGIHRAIRLPVDDQADRIVEDWLSTDARWTMHKASGPRDGDVT